MAKGEALGIDARLTFAFLLLREKKNRMELFTGDTTGRSHNHDRNFVEGIRP
jgi:hypothetical protein